MAKSHLRFILKYYKNIWPLFICFLYCAKEGRVAENTESDVATLKMVVTMQKWWRRGEQIFRSIFVAPCCFPEKEVSSLWSSFGCEVALSIAIACSAALWICKDVRLEILPIVVYLRVKNGKKTYTETKYKICSNLLANVLEQLTVILLFFD